MSSERNREAEVARRRRVAAMLADTLAPLVDEHFAGLPVERPKARVIVSTDPALARTVTGAVEAWERFAQARYTGDEPRARRALERACEALARRYRAKEPRHVA